MRRRDAIKNIAITSSAIMLGACEFDSLNKSNTKKDNNKARNSNSLNLKKAQSQDSSNNFKRKLNIPKIESWTSKNNVKNFNLSVQKGISNFMGKEIETYGINASFLGTTLRFKKNDLVSMKVKNNLDVATTCHWHGFHVEGKNDGSMHQSIKAGELWNPSFKINNQAGTYFYHAHTHGKTGEQVYKGLSSMIIVDDDISENLAIPNDYGIDDIPLIIGDKYFTKDGSMPYRKGMMITMMGHMGNTYLVNGSYKPLLKAKKSLLRFRILNTSNTRTIFLGFSDKREFYQIATDAGFMENSLAITYTKIAPAERVEILVDISNAKDELFINAYENYNFVPIVKIDTTKAKKSLQKVPTKLSNIDWINPKEAIKHREMVLRMRHGSLSINNVKFAHDILNEKVKLNSTEIWTISTTSGPMDHPFHIHGTSFQVLSRNGKAPLLTERGWKDVVLVRSGETVKVIMRFNYKADKNNPYMYHCHILEHEDAGMMGQFSVT